MTTSSVNVVETTQRTCLLVAPLVADLSIVRRLLRERGVEPIVFSDVPPLGVTILDQLNKALMQSDTVIFVLAISSANANTFFEIGLALGQGKKLMVIAPDNGADMPSDIRELMVVRAQLDNEEAIGFLLDQFLAAPRSNGAPMKIPSIRTRGQPLGMLADVLIQRAEVLKNRVTHQPVDEVAHREFEQIIVEALEASQVAPIVPSRQEDRQVDLAVWVDELDSLGLNPLLIELKLHLDTQKAIDAAVTQADSYVHLYRAPAIMVLFVVGLPEQIAERALLSRSVYFINLVDLLDRMRTKSFGAVLRAAFFDGMAMNKI